MFSLYCRHKSRVYRRQHFTVRPLRHCCGSEKSTWGRKVGLTAFEYPTHQQHRCPIQDSCAPRLTSLPPRPRWANGRVEQHPGRINGTESRRQPVMLRRVRQSLRQVLFLMARRPGLLCGAVLLGVLLVLAVKFTCR